MRSNISRIYDRGTLLYKAVNKSSNMGTRSYDDRNSASYAPTGVLRQDLLEWAITNSSLNNGLRDLIDKLRKNCEVDAFSAIEAARNWLTTGRCVEIDGIIVFRNGQSLRNLKGLVSEYKKRIVSDNETVRNEDRSQVAEVKRTKGRFSSGPWSY